MAISRLLRCEDVGADLHLVYSPRGNHVRIILASEQESKDFIDYGSVHILLFLLMLFCFGSLHLESREVLVLEYSD